MTMVAGQTENTTVRRRVSGPDPLDAPLRNLPATAVLKYGCVDCGRETEEYPGHLVSMKRLGLVTVRERAESLRCERTGCGGELTVDVVVNA